MLKHNMSEKARMYQARITGRPYNLAEGTSEEWVCFLIAYDGFVAAECLLQEAKGDYDQFIDANWMSAARLTTVFASMRNQITRQATAVHANPPTKLMWYFQGPKARMRVLDLLNQNGVKSVVVP